MSRLIDADKALEIVHNQGIAHPNAYHLTNYATLILRKAPTVDAVEKKVGSIIETIEDGHMKRVFSFCEVSSTEMTCWMTANYCPNCGAKMDGERKTV